MRTYRHRHLILLSFAIILLLPIGASADPETDGRLLAAQCAQCHGTDGRARGDIDSLAGEDAMELYLEMMEMRSDDDDDEIMHFQARGYSEQQIRLIALYFASLPSHDDDRDKDSDGDEGEAVDEAFRELRKQQLEREREVKKKERERRKERN